MQQEIQEAITTKVAYGSAGGLVILGMFNIQEFGIICGIVLGVLTFLLNMYMKIKDDRRKEAADRRLAEWQEMHTPEGKNKVSATEQHTD